MRRCWLICFGGLAAGLIAYACVYLGATTPERSAEQSSHPQLAWLKEEYRLTEAQFAEVAKLHEKYGPKCAEMCRRIDDQNAKIGELLSATNTITPEIKGALAQAAQLRAECQAAMLEHFYQVSRAMDPEQGKRYLAWVQSETLLPGQMVPTGPGMKMNK
jgi:hypothetical protein